MFIQTTDYGETNIYSSLWDKYWCPQAVTWIGVVLFPPFTYYAIADHWASTKFLILDEMPKAAYTLKELFSSETFTVPAISSKLNAGTFYLPSSGTIVAVLVVQFVVYILVNYYLSNVLSQSDYVGLPYLYFIDKRYWETRRLAKNAAPKGSLMIQNIVKSYQTGLFKKSYNVILNDVSFTINPGTVCGLMGLTGSGKTTMCKIL